MIYIIEIHWCVPYEASGTITKPIEFDGTLEKLEFEFELLAEKHHGKRHFDFKNIKDIDPSDFFEDRKYYGPNIFTLEDWLKREGVN